MIRLLIVAESLGAGVLTFISEQVRCLGDNYSVRVCYGSRSETPKELSRVLGGRCEVFEINFSDKPLHILKKIVALIDDGSDIVHAHSSVAGFYVRVSSLFLKTNPVIYYNPHAYSFLRFDYGLFFRCLFFFGEFLLARFPRCTTVSVSASEHRITTKKLWHRRGIYIPNGVRIVPDEKVGVSERNAATIRVGTMGRLTLQKNPDFFFGLAREFPNMDFIWIGGGEHRSRYEAKNVKITGWLNHDQAIEELKMLDIYIQPSLWEGMPLSLLEAMQYQKLCLASAIQAHKECIEHGVTGFIYKARGECVDLIESLVANHELRLVIGVAARNSVKEKFGLNRVTREYDCLYLKHYNDIAERV